MSDSLKKAGAGPFIGRPPADQPSDAAAPPEPSAAPPSQVALTGHLTFTDAVRFLDAAPKVVLDPGARHHMADVREKAVELARTSGDDIYAWTTSVGMHVSEKVPADDPAAQRAQQLDLLRRSDAGSGARLSTATVRLALLFRANAMASGEMGVRPEVADRLLALLNAGITPVVPASGSMGNGDLPQMARIGRAAIADSVPVRYQGRQGPASEILPQAGLDPFELQMGEAISILSGSTVVSAALAVALKKAEDVSALTDAALAMSAEALRADLTRLDWFEDPRSEAEMAAANALGPLLQGSQRGAPQARAALGEGARVQEVFSLRTSVEAHSIVRDEVARAVKALETQLQSTPINPKVLSRDDGSVFFRQSGSSSALGLGHAAASLNGAMLPLAEYSMARARQVIEDPRLDLKRLVVAQSTTIPMLTEMRANAAPASAFADVAKSQQEDVSSMALTSVQKLDANLDQLMEMLCLELLVAYRGIEAAAPRLGGAALGAGTGLLRDYLAEVLPKGTGGSPAEDLEALRAELRSGHLLNVLGAIASGASEADVTRMRKARPAASWELGEPELPAVRAPLVLPTARSEWRDLGMLRAGSKWSGFYHHAPTEVVALGRDLYWPEPDYDRHREHSHTRLSLFRAGEGRHDSLRMPEGMRCYTDPEPQPRRSDRRNTNPQLIVAGDTLIANVPDAVGGPKLIRRGRYDADWSEPVPGSGLFKVAFCPVPGKGLYALGGSGTGNPYMHQQLKSAQVLDEQTREWRALPDLPIPRAGASAFYVKGRIYVVGGPPEPNRVDRFNPTTEQWEKPIFLRNDWSTQVSAWVEDDQIILGAGKNATDGWNTQVEIIDASDPARPVVEKAPGLGFENVDSLRIIDTDTGKVALGSEAEVAFALEWRPPEPDEEP
ncbi:MAG: aromatic amino acid lyase [Archangiaceae bacterium]|nr:aromatic amino acid lyase [Archangiaceae bacterium]